jgi:adenylate kinase
MNPETDEKLPEPEGARKEQQKPKLIIMTNCKYPGMPKRVILITGTPCTGKTTLSKQLTQKLGAYYVNLTDYAKTNGLVLREDKKRNTSVVDEEKMRGKLEVTITQAQQETVIVDGHYAYAVVPSQVATHVFVLRKNPIELKQHMQNCGFPEKKIRENLSAEILDVCLVEALQMQKGKVCELDATGKTVEALVEEVLEILEDKKPCQSGFVDWLGLLEREGLTDQFLE